MSKIQKDTEIIDALVSLFESSSERVVLPLTSNSYDCAVRVGSLTEGYNVFFIKVMKKDLKEEKK